jgi:hypothetical protein
LFAAASLLLIGLVALATPVEAAFLGSNGKIAFYTSRDGQFEIYAMNSDGTGPTNLSQTSGATEEFPVWSPDGTKIAYNRNGEIYIMNADGTGQSNLTSPGQDVDPAWSPDGTKIAFTSYRDGGAAEIYTMNADGTGQTRLTNNSVSDEHASWQALDTVAPETTIDSGPSGSTADTTPTFTFSSSEPGSIFQCRIDTGGFASCSSPQTTSALADGSHSFEVRATDQAGNTDPTPASRTFTVLTVPGALPRPGGPGLSPPMRERTEVEAIEVQSSSDRSKHRPKAGAASDRHDRQLPALGQGDHHLQGSTREEGTHASGEMHEAARAREGQAMHLLRGDPGSVRGGGSGWEESAQVQGPHLQPQARERPVRPDCDP